MWTPDSAGIIRDILVTVMQQRQEEKTHLNKEQSSENNHRTFTVMCHLATMQNDYVDHMD